MRTITDIMLERYLADDLPPHQAKEIESALAENPELSERLANLRASSAAFIDKQSPEVFARRLAGRLEHEAPERSSWLTLFQSWSPALVLFCAVFGIFWTTLEPVHEDEFSMAPVLDGMTRAGPLEEQSVAPEKRLARAEPEERANSPLPSAAEISISSEPQRRPAQIKRRAKKTKRTLRSGPKSASADQAPVLPSLEEGAELPPMVALSARSNKAQVRRSRTGEKSSQHEIAARKGTSRLLMAQTARTVNLVVRTPKGTTRPLEQSSRLLPEEELLAQPDWRGPMYWGYLITQEGRQTPLVNELEARSWRHGSTLARPIGYSGPATIWIAACFVSFSTEDILFDGFRVVSKNENCRVFSFFALF